MDYKKKFDLRNKTIFVLGGSGLIGKEVSKALSEFGAKVIVVDQNIKKDSKKKFTEKVNLSNLPNLKKNINKLIKKYKVPDIMVNCTYPKTKDWKNNSFEKINLSSYKKNVDMHLNSYVWSAKIIADLMKKNKKGSIILLSSIYGVVGQDLSIYEGTKMQESLSYSVIKGGINNLTKQMASYYGKFQIRINALCAGGVFNNQNEKFVKSYKKKVPLKRMATSSDIALSVIFLASDASSYITGTTFMVDGGWTSI